MEQIAEVGNSSNNVTTYDVVVGISNPEGIKLGMNANVTIQVESKENALVIPAEALVEINNKKYVRVIDNTNTSGTGTSISNTNTQEQSGQGENAASAPNTQNSSGENGNSQNTASTQSSSGTNNYPGTRIRQSTSGAKNIASSQVAANMGRLVEIKTGLENENYIEVTEGLTEGQKVIITLPQTSTTTNSTNRNNQMNMGGFGGGMTTGGMSSRVQGGVPRD